MDELRQGSVIVDSRGRPLGDRGRYIPPDCCIHCEKPLVRQFGGGGHCLGPDCGGYSVEQLVKETYG